MASEFIRQIVVGMAYVTISFNREGMASVFITHIGGDVGCVAISPIIGSMASVPQCHSNWLKNVLSF